MKFVLNASNLILKNNYVFDTSSKTKKFLWWIFPKIQRAKKDIIVYKILDTDGHALFRSRFRYHYGYNYPIKPCVNPTLMDFRVSLSLSSG